MALRKKGHSLFSSVLLRDRKWYGRDSFSERSRFRLIVLHRFSLRRVGEMYLNQAGSRRISIL